MCMHVIKRPVMQVYYKNFSNELILRFYLICLKNIDIKYDNIVLFESCCLICIYQLVGGTDLQ